MRVSIQAAGSTLLCQRDQLISGFRALGHEHTDDITEDVAFVFVGNPPFTGWANLARTGVRKTIFNVLDIPWHVPEVNDLLAKWREELPAANRVTAISDTVSRQVQEHCGVNCETIYYPMKPVRATGEKKHPYKVLACGRLGDPNKFYSTAVTALVRAGFKESDVAVVGPERVHWGMALGVVSDETLNDLYNSVDYVIMLDKNAGLGLPAIEAACCGAIPIVAAHLQTREELWTASPLGLQYATLNSPDSIAALIQSIEADATWKAQLKRDFKDYADKHFRPKFEAREVAKRIVSVYHSINP